MTDFKVHLPSEWKDDQKMSVMFAPFRDRSLNPQSWDRKLKFWTNVIAEDCRINKRIKVDLKELQTRFMRNGKKPGCLDVVLKEMQRNSKLRKLSWYQRSGSSSWLGWGFNTFVWAPVAWGLNSLWKKSDSTEEPLVFHDILKEQCALLLDRHYSMVQHESTDNVMELVTLRTQFASLCCSEQEFDIVLQQLQLDREIIISQTLERDTVVKFCKKGDRHVSPITDLEINVFRIQKVVKNLEAQTEVLSQQCDRLTQEAKSHLKDGKKTLALQSLRRKKRVERTLTQKLSSLDQLHNMMSKIQDAATNEMILKAYESGMSAVKSLNQETPIDKVESVMDDIKDTLEDQGEVTMLISQDLSSSDTSQDDLERELSDLLIADQRALEGESNALSDLLEGLSVHEPIPNLPDVPSFSPSKAENPYSKEKTPSKQKLMTETSG